ncbi:unnamed protein product [Ceratitis capitata]|uniref:(Mediterranean fruit fly) hypothetical protein n=1 Tax=Ceratitis capitata TaxID=7213 RepID=A0A811VAE4_CERCA|nr:unnamed protein product [Ceratitis capitata]
MLPTFFLRLFFPFLNCMEFATYAFVQVTYLRIQSVLDASADRRKDLQMHLGYGNAFGYTVLGTTRELNIYMRQKEAEGMRQGKTRRSDGIRNGRDETRRDEMTQTR